MPDRAAPTGKAPNLETREVISAWLRPVAFLKLPELLISLSPKPHSQSEQEKQKAQVLLMRPRAKANSVLADKVERGRILPKRAS